MGCGLHVCGDELAALMGILAGSRLIIPWIKAKWSGRHKDCQNPKHDHGG